MATLVVQSILSAGITPALVAAAVGGDEFADDGQAQTFIECVNGHTVPINVTVAVQKPGPHRVAGVGSLTAASLVIAVTNAQRRLIGPFTQAYINSSTGRVALTYSVVTAFTVGAFKVRKED